MRSHHLRREIASAAARLIAEEGMRDYGMAKRKAARQLGAGPNDELPTNSEIEAAVRTYQSLYLADEQPGQLQRMREIALELMHEFERFRPCATGALVDGTAGRFGTIELQLFADSAKEVELFLLNRGMDFDTRDPRRLDRNGLETTLIFEWDDYPIELAIYPPEAERSRHREGHGGRVRERLRAAALEALLQDKETTES